LISIPEIPARAELNVALDSRSKRRTTPTGGSSSTARPAAFPSPDLCRIGERSAIHTIHAGSLAEASGFRSW
jgi:hypothetical protein